MTTTNQAATDQRIVDHLAGVGHANTAAEVAAYLILPVSSVRGAVKRLVQDGRLEPVGGPKGGARCYGVVFPE